MTFNVPDYNHSYDVNAFPGMIFPDPSHVFEDRAKRFEALSHKHPLGGWLSFLGRISQLQHNLLQDYPTLPMPDDQCLAFARKRNMPPLPASSWPREPVWKQALAQIIRDLLPYATAEAQEILFRLRSMDNAFLDVLADRILRLSFNNQHVEFFPFIAAALQVHWTALAAKLNGTKIPRLNVPGICPCCGFLPVAGIIHPSGEIANLRYLHCGLCNTEWHLVRVTCAACTDITGVTYRYMENSDGAVRAETCDRCRSYLKILYREKNHQADPVADDLATLALDLLVEDADYHRMSPNLLFATGS